MKKIVCLTLALFAPVLVQAMPLSNIADPGLYRSRGIVDCEFCDSLSFRLGYYGDFVFEREIHRYVSDGDNGNAVHASWYTNAAELVINFYDFMDFFGTIGQSNFSVINSVLASGVAQINTYDATVSWSVGNRACWEWCNFVWGYELQYQHCTPLRDAVIPLSFGEIVHRQSNNKETYSEWQGGIGAAYKIESCGYFDLVPYMGLTFSGLRWNQSRTGLAGQKVIYRQAKAVGYSVGATALLGNTMGLTAEARFASETALYVSGQFRF